MKMITNKSKFKDADVVMLLYKFEQDVEANNTLLASVIMKKLELNHNLKIVKGVYEPVENKDTTSTTISQ